MERLNTEWINNYVEHQLAVWPLAKRNFDALSAISRRPLMLGDLTVYAQHNPARIKSTGAKTDAASISKRPCFLCASNRPPEQISQGWVDGWELLLNPYPILPIHFTIVDVKHRRQDAIPSDMAAMAEEAPALAIFYNGARAGASAPDHRHCQAVLKSELPLIQLAEKHHTRNLPPIVSSEVFGLDLPFNFMSAIITPDQQGLRNLYLMTQIKGIDAETGNPDADLVNAFFWIDSEGLLRIIVIPRRAHRPSCFFAEDDSQMTVSPGALDMAGLLILPIEKDYERINPQLARQIYSEVAFAGSLPDNII